MGCFIVVPVVLGQQAHMGTLSAKSGGMVWRFRGVCSRIPGREQSWCKGLAQDCAWLVQGPARPSKATVVTAIEQGRAQQGEKEAMYFFTSWKAMVSGLTFPPNETEAH